MAAPGAVVVGTGFGARIHVPALTGAGFRVAALVGTDAERTRRRAERCGTRGLVDLRQALELPGVVAATIASPPAEHASHAVAALEAGKHVICEKPFALNAEDARRMRDLAESQGAVALVGHEFRFAPERALVTRLIREGVVGVPRLATWVSLVDLVTDADARMPPWWFDRGRGGGWLGASGSHVVDQLLQWLGSIEWASGTLSKVSDRSNEAAEDSFGAILGFAGGALAVISQSGASRGAIRPVVTVSGSAGTVWIDGSEVWIATQAGTARAEMPDDLVLERAVSDSPNPRDFSHLELGPYTRLARVFRELIDVGDLRGGERPATFSDGVACMEVLDAIRNSARLSGERVVPASSAPAGSKG